MKIEWPQDANKNYLLKVTYVDAHATKDYVAIVRLTDYSLDLGMCTVVDNTGSTITNVPIKEFEKIAVEVQKNHPTFWWVTK